MKTFIVEYRGRKYIAVAVNDRCDTLLLIDVFTKKLSRVSTEQVQVVEFFDGYVKEAEARINALKRKIAASLE